MLDKTRDENDPFHLQGGVIIRLDEFRFADVPMETLCADKVAQWLSQNRYQLSQIIASGMKDENLFIRISIKAEE